MKLRSATLLCSLTLACAGRSATAVTHPAKVHELGDKQAYVATYDARGRGAYVVVNTDGAKGGESKSILLCAEPPPDTSANLDYSDVLESSVEASAAYELIDAALNVGTDREVEASSEVVDVVARSELVLLMRDALYRLCEFHLNGTMTAEQVSANYNELLRMAKTLGQRDNVAHLVRALVVALENDASPEVVAQLLMTIQALSFVEAAEASADAMLKLTLSLAATRVLSEADRKSVTSRMKQEYEAAVAAAKDAVAKIEAELDGSGITSAERAELQRKLDEAKEQLRKAEAALEQFEQSVD